MSLGSIAHIQHYFARTGLLEGKGGHVGQAPLKILQEEREKENAEPESLFGDFTRDLPASLPQYLDPTASTYRQAPIQGQPPPSIDVLRRELRETLTDAKSVLANLQSVDEFNKEDPDASQGWHEVEGAHVIDLVTLALRAAKEYYVCHTCPARLFRLRSERQLRADAHNVLDVMKLVASKNLRGGFRTTEVDAIRGWATGIEDLVNQDETAEQAAESFQRQWPWMRGDWTGRERERERLFMYSFDPLADSRPLPVWKDHDSNSAEPSLFLFELRDGVRLIKLHNALVQASKRRFGQVDKHHADTEKPYRRSENLRYWIKAAELRWEVKLDLPASALAVAQSGRGDAKVWKMFDIALLQWCRAVREELTREATTS